MHLGMNLGNVHRYRPGDILVASFCASIDGRLPMRSQLLDAFLTFTTLFECSSRSRYVDRDTPLFAPFVDLLCAHHAVLHQPVNEVCARNVDVEAKVVSDGSCHGQQPVTFASSRRKPAA